MGGYIEFSALIIAGAALFLSYSQSKSTIMHNKLSVRPLLHFATCIHDGEDFKVSLVNSGTGPAIIENITIIYKSTKHVISLPDEYIKLFDTLKIKIDKKNAYTTKTFPKGSVISAETEGTLIHFNDTSENANILTFFRQNITSMQIVVNYQNIYGDSFLERSIKADKKHT